MLLERRLLVVSKLLISTDFFLFLISRVSLIKRPVRDACLYMGEASLPALPDPPTPPDPPAPPDPHFVFAIAPIL